jgi:DNA-directed RNA polymerase subunit M/transcription elongation factor TFIIS
MSMMEPMNAIDASTRSAWVKLFEQLAVQNPTWPSSVRAWVFARQLEHHAHASRQQLLNIAGLNVMRYGTSDLLAIECPSTHQAAALAHYLRMMRRLAWVLARANLAQAGATNIDRWMTASDDKFIEGSAHAAWESQFYAQQERARDILSCDKQLAPHEGIFQCPKCKSFDVDTDQKQTRSADEPMTVFCCCNSCGKRFVR